jgi:peptide/nickel transport system substrate-binding protein
VKNMVLRCATCLVVLVLIVSACSPAQAPATEPTEPAAQPSEAAEPTQEPSAAGAFDPDVLYIAHHQDPATMDAHLATSVAEQYTHNCYDRLTEVDRETGKVVGVLAESWDLSSDGLTYTLHLREGVKFHDGTDFDAESVKLNFERIAALNASMTSVWQYIDNIEVVDDLTLDVTLTQPLALWPNFLVTNPKIVCPSAIKDHEVDGDWGQAYLAEHVCGTGAYTLEAWEKGRELHLVKFDDYWRGWDGKHVSEVHQLIIPEPGTQRMMLEAGDLDVALLYSDDFIPAYEANPDIKLVTERNPEQFYCRLNTNGGPTADKNVRLALAYMFDFQQFQDLSALPQPRSDGPVPMALFPDRDTAPEIPYNTYDLEKAREYLAMSDYPDGFKMSIIADAEEARDRTFVQVLQAQAAEFGIDIEIISEAWSYTISRGDCKECQSNPDDPLFVNGFMLRTPPLYPDPSAFLERMYLTKDEGGVRNFLWYRNEDVIDLTVQGMSTPDREEAMELYWEANLEIIEDVPDIFIDQFHFVSPMRQWVQGYLPDALQSWEWTYYYIWKE